MSRAGAGVGEPVVIKPSNDIYTVLAGVATVMTILGILVVWMRAGEIFGGLLSAAK